MTKVTLKLSEIIQLEAELNGITNTQTQEVVSKGLLSEKLKMTVKYWLSDLSKKVVTEREAVNSLRDASIKKYGVADEQGNISLPVYLPASEKDVADGKPQEINPQFIEFQNEFNALLAEERDLDVYEFKLADFDNVETSENYQIIFKLIKVD